MSSFRLLFFVSVALTVFACKEEIPQAPELPLAQSNRLVYVINEGNFQWGNATITRFDRISKQKTNDDYFESANQRPLGDVAQSITFHNGLGYLVINNSSKIEVVDSTTFVTKGVISGLTSPRYLLPVGGNKAYVTDIYSNCIWVVNLNTRTLIKTIPCRGWTEELLLHNGKVWVTNLRTNYLYRINPVTDIMEDSVLLGFPAGSLVTDVGNKLWVLCSQVLQANAPSRLMQLNAQGTQVTKVFDLGTGAGKVLRTSPDRTQLYWIKGHIYSMHITADSLPVAPLITKQSGENFYSLGIDPVSGEIYAGDALDYVQKGNVKCFSTDGAFITSFKAGITPGNFTFN